MIPELAQAVVVALNGHPFSKSFTAERHWLPLFKLEDLESLTVAVVFRTEARTTFSRRDTLHMPVVDVGIMQRPEDLELATLDALVVFVEEVADFLDRLDMGDWAWASTEVKALAAPEHLRVRRQFTSVLSITYRQARTPGA